MKLVADAVRDVLLYLENNLYLTVENGKTIYDNISFKKLADTLTPSNHYSKEEVIYAIQQLYNSQMISVKIHSGNNEKWTIADIYDITWQGHEFLNDIRIQSVWEATKEKAEKLGGMSIKALSFLSAQVIKAITSNPQLISDIIQSIK